MSPWSPPDRINYVSSGQAADIRMVGIGIYCGFARAFAYYNLWHFAFPSLSSYHSTYQHPIYCKTGEIEQCRLRSRLCTWRYSSLPLCRQLRGTTSHPVKLGKPN